MEITGKKQRKTEEKTKLSTENIPNEYLPKGGVCGDFIGLKIRRAVFLRFFFRRVFRTRIEIFQIEKCQEKFIIISLNDELEVHNDVRLETSFRYCVVKFY